ncbi:MAG: spore cortex-lytic enzyme [Clostridiales bacterium]|nr:spore cortex-lytic enzyme [Clostridiales bacterium]
MFKENNPLKREIIAWELAAILLFGIMGISSAAKKSDALPDTYVQTLSRLGSRGDEVRKIQSVLKGLGLYKGGVDGIYGPKTAVAVKQFQKNCGLTVDGIAGPKTLLYLGLGTSSSSSGHSSSDITLLAKVIAAEARGESYTGQVAVGAVILNRVEHASFPDTISGVIYQNGAFTCVTDSNWSVAPDATSRKAAQDAINGWDPSGGAIYYYNPAKTTNKWMLSRPVITTIGSHIFCS